MKREKTEKMKFWKDLVIVDGIDDFIKVNSRNSTNFSGTRMAKKLMAGLVGAEEDAAGCYSSVGAVLIAGGRRRMDVSGYRYVFRRRALQRRNEDTAGTLVGDADQLDDAQRSAGRGAVSLPVCPN